MAKNLPRAFALLLPLLFAFAAPLAHAITISASLEKDTIHLGEVTAINVTCAGGRPRSLPQVQPISGLAFHYAGESSQVTIVNGQFSQSITFSFRVTPQAEGRFVIPGAIVDIGGQAIRTSPFTLTVLAANAPPPNTSNNNPLAKYAFMRLATPKTNVFVGEVFLVEVKLYFQSAPGIQIPQALGDGFRFTLLRPVSTQKREQFGNSLYNVVTFSTGAIATKPGDLPLAFDTELTLLLYSQGTIFGERRPVKLTTETNVFHVSALPSNNVPPSFNGAVGSFNLAMSAGPSNVVVGDPVTVKLQVAGRGEFDALQLPPIAAWREFKTYPPTSKVELTDQLGTTGVKNFEIVALPENAEVKELAPIEFSFFDPEQGAYRTLSTPRVPLTVRAGTTAQQQPTIVAVQTNSTSATPPPPPPAQDIVHIKARPGSLAHARPPLVEQPAFLALQSLPMLAWLTLVVRRRRAENLANNPRRQRELATERLVKSGLAEARAHAGRNDAAQFFATVFRLLQERLGERLDLPASGITEEVIDARLGPLGVSAPTLGALRELFQSCNQARYAPQGSRESMTALLARAEGVLNELRKINPA